MSTLSDNTSDFYDYVSAEKEEETLWADDALSQAMAMVDHLIGSTDVPESVVRNAYYTAGAEIYYRRETKFGVTQFADNNGASLRVGKDPLVAATQVLAPFLIGVA